MADDSGRLNQVFSETSFLYGGNAAFIEGLHERWAQDPNSVSPAWRAFFEQLRDSADSVKAAAHAGSWGRAPQIARTETLSALDGDWPAATVSKVAKAVQEKKPGATEADIRAAAHDFIRALMLIRTYRIRGHLQANLDPLGIEPPIQNRELEPEHYGFTEADMDREIYIDGVLGLQTATLREILALVKRTYCGNVGVQYMHISEPNEKQWIQERIEGRDKEIAFTPEGKVAILKKLIELETFERFLHRRFPGTKRFGLDGGEATIPALEQVIKRGGSMGVREIVLGLAHRGRLNTLAAVMGKPYRAIFHEFQGGSSTPDDIQGSGDVKYHLGASSDREFDGRKVPPVADRPIRATSRSSTRWCWARRGPSRRRTADLDGDRSRVHAGADPRRRGLRRPGRRDARCCALRRLKGYRTGGTLHVVINNQIGFTTRPRSAAPRPTAPDVAHDDPGADLPRERRRPGSGGVAARIAIEFRQIFHKDVVVDMVCYRQLRSQRARRAGFHAAADVQRSSRTTRARASCTPTSWCSKA